jgi:hypothetical protein
VDRGDLIHRSMIDETETKDGLLEPLSDSDVEIGRAHV